MKLKNLVLLFALVFTISSCEDEVFIIEDPNSSGTDTPDEEDYVLLKSVTVNYLDGGSDTTYLFYDGNVLTSMSNSWGVTINYIYENNILVRMNVLFSNEIVSHTLLEYDSNNRLSSFISYHTEDYYDYDWAEAVKVEPTYNQDGSITFRAYVGDHDSQNTFSYEITNTYIDGQLASSTMPNETELEVVYEYDTKNGILKNVFDIKTLDLLGDFTESGALMSINNNLIKEDLRPNEDGIEDLFEYEYTYNSSDYPISCITYDEGVEDGSMVFTYY